MTNFGAGQTTVKRKSVVMIALVAVLVLGALALPFVVVPGLLPCTVARVSAFERLSPALLVDPSLSGKEREALQELLGASRARIENTFGGMQSAPLVVVFAEPFARSFRLNMTASTAPLPGRACVLVGPQGRNIDVLAHELVHAEVYERVGFWNRWMNIPVWFDEGIAMQVDHRSHFELAAVGLSESETDFVRQLVDAKAFFSRDGRQATRNYAAARFEAAKWLRGVGAKKLYNRLEWLRDGKDFSEIYAPE